MTDVVRAIDDSPDAVGRFGFAPTWPGGFTWPPSTDRRPGETDSEYIGRIWPAIVPEAY